MDGKMDEKAAEHVCVVKQAGGREKRFEFSHYRKTKEFLATEFQAFGNIVLLLLLFLLLLLLVCQGVFLSKCQDGVEKLIPTHMKRKDVPSDT